MFLDRLKKLSRYREHIYTDERIAPRQDLPLQQVPAPIRSIRSLEDEIAGCRQSREQIFYKQAKLLERYEDDCPYDREVVRYYPTYQSLNNAELRGYFTWRTRVRAGKLEKTSLSFAFLYLYELINQIGCQGPLDGYEKMKAFRDAYAVLDDRIVRYTDTWLRDYVIYYNLDHSLLEGKAANPVDQAMLVLLDLDAHTDEEILEAFRSVSSYPPERSRFFKTHMEELRKILAPVLRQVREHYERSCRQAWTEDFFGSTLTIHVRLFPSAIFYERTTNEDFDYEIDPLRIYHNRHGRWTFTYFDTSRMQKNKSGALLRTMDSLMREAFGFPYPVKPGLEQKWLTELIQKQTALYLEEKKQSERKVLQIDYSLLDQIRKNADYTKERLITPEETETETVRSAAVEEPALAGALPAAPPAAALAASAKENSASEESPALRALLSKDELHYLQSLLDGSDLSWIRQQGLLPSILTDSINDKLFDLFSDTVLDEDGVLPDYIEELSRLIR